MLGGGDCASVVLFFFSFLAADRRAKQTDDRQMDRLRVKELFDSIGVR